MINIEIQDEKAEANFTKFLKPKIARFGEKFNINTSVTVSDFKPMIYQWLGIEKKELDKFETKKELVKYLRIKQGYAQELRKWEQAQHDRFKSYDVIIDLLACLLENKPVQGTPSVPALIDIESIVHKSTPYLEQWDLVAIRELKEAVLNHLSEKSGVK